ncbi:hypothetical protein HYU07_06275 [Candidatus Woesearchaeota archaeon]|nr:hypothetical protein [Candidatus Woesearchaeota archaeon]
MHRRKTDMSETSELLSQHIDLRSSWGAGAWKTILRYIRKKDTSKISTIKNLIGIAPEKYHYLDEMLDNVHAADMAYNATCIGGHNFKQGYIMRIGTKDFFIGKECYDMLSHFSLGEFKETVKEASKKKKRKELEELIFEVSPELRETMAKAGIDAEQLLLISELIKDNVPLNEQSLLYELDPGKRRSFLNYFREGIKNKTITNEEIIYIHDKLQTIAHRVSSEELAKLVIYSYEYRPFKTEAVMGIVKDDLEYLSKLKDDELVKRYGRIELDEHYEIPAARYREREDFEKLTVKERLDESKPYMTFFEAWAIKLHFRKKGQDIEKIRMESNRKVAEKYGVGPSWHYILKEVGSIFEEEKAKLAKEFSEFGRIVYEHVLTEKEHKIAKDFLERSRIGRITEREIERENYLRMFSIREFMETAPVIVSIGRKVRFARRMYENTGDEWLKQGLIKQDYFLKEELSDNFKDWTGIDKNADDLIDMILNARFVKSKRFSDFQEKHGALIKEMYGNGLVAKKYLGSFVKYNAVLEKEKVRKLNDETTQKMEKIEEYKELPFIDYKGYFSMMINLKNTKYAPKKIVDIITATYSNFEKLLQMAHFDEKTDLAEIERNIKELKKGAVVYIDERRDASSLCLEIYDIKEMKVGSYGFFAYNLNRVKEVVGKIRSCERSEVEVGNNFLKKLEKLTEKRILREKISDYVRYITYVKDREGKRFFASKEFKEKVERVYNEVKAKR